MGEGETKEEASEAEALEIGDICKVRWRDGEENEQILLAKIIERRPVNSRRKRRKGAAAATAVATDLKELPPDKIEYYVHYVEHDRRLDEWVTYNKFLLESLQHAKDFHRESEKQPRQSSRRSRSSMTMSSGKNTSTSTNNNKSSDNSKDSSFFTGGNWHGNSGGDPTLAALELEHEEATKVKNIEKIVMGTWEIEAWYFSPYPDEYSQEPTLYVCEYCLKYMRKAKTLKKHKAECSWRRPPGKEIYREADLSVFEVDGKDNKVYCQNLCLLAKLFLDHKTLYYDVEPFLFYIITHVDAHGAHIVGYFSKEKNSAEEYNLACILTFPQYQLHGYGKFIISLSYELSKREHKTGSPEKPLSDLGKISYRSYWTHILLNLLAEHDTSKDISIKDISMQTGVKTEDIISTLQSLDMIKVWKGQHVVYVQQDIIDNYMKQNKRLRLCKSEFLHWEPPATQTDKKSVKR